MSVTAQRAGGSTRRAARRAARSDWMERLGRLGLAARGVVYCLVGVLAIQIATGDHPEADRNGALRAVADEPFGKVLLVALCVGFAGYALWRFVKAITGAGEGTRHADDDATGIARRLADVGRGLVYVAMFVTAVKLLVGSGAGQGSDEEATSWSARLLAHAYGQWLVGLFGAGVIVAGIVLAVRAFQQKFAEHLKLYEMSPWQRRWLPALGTFGYFARGVVAALVGVFFVKAAVTFDPRQATGVDGSLERLAHASYGTWVLAIVALGLIAFGLFSFVEARYRKVLDD